MYSFLNPICRADTIPLDELRDADDALNAKGLNFNRDLNGASGSNPSRPHTPNPILAPSNTAWHNCRRLIFVPRCVITLNCIMNRSYWK